MTSALVVLITSILHFGLRGSCFLSIERFPMVPGTAFAGHIAYCGLLHFLYDMDLVPRRYQRRMGWLARTIIELVLGIAAMEVCALWLWCNVEHICHMSLQYSLKYCGMPVALYQQWEWLIMGSVMTSLAALLWLNAFRATDPIETNSVATSTLKPAEEQLFPSVSVSVSVSETVPLPLPLPLTSRSVQEQPQLELELELEREQEAEPQPEL